MGSASEPIFFAQNRGFRYGDGLFETAKVLNGKIVLEDYHFERLFFGLKMLHIDNSVIDRKSIIEKVTELCKLNNCLNSARVRLAVFRNEADDASYLIETFPLPEETNKLNEQGWKIGLHPYVRKSMDAYANLKTANYLPYVLADIYAKDKQWNECLVLNTENNICDGSKTNIFLLMKDEVWTPSLNQGCVNGVKRRFIIEELKKRGLPVHQKEITEEHLNLADEVFLTNAIQDIRWVQFFKNREYGSNFIQQFYQDTFVNLYTLK